MTDFIHEHPKTEESAPAAPAAPEPELDEKTGQKRVYGYIFLLFIVAFSLLLWAFFMNQRGTDQVLSELRGNASALQTTLDRNVELEKRVDELESEIDALKRDAEQQKLAAAQREQELTEERARAAARSLLWQLENRFAAEDYDACRAVCEQLKPLAYALRTGEDGGAPSELTRYEEIAAALAEAEQE